MAQSERPLSPHLGIYRWEVANSLSIVHRLTGVMLSFGALALVGWLVSIVVGLDAYTALNTWWRTPIGVLMLFGWTFCFFYHLANGIRHLFWDIGRGFEKRRARITGWAVVIVAIGLTLGFWATAWQLLRV